jgi:putative ABC transport system permease protein
MSTFKTALFLARKSIVKGNKWALIFVILAMSLSFINLNFVPAILSGSSDMLENQMVDTLLANVIIDPEEDEFYIDQAPREVEMIRQVPGVVGASAHLNTSALIEYGWKKKDSPSDKGISGTWAVIGIDPEQEANVTTIHEHIIEGSYLDENDRDEIVLGIEIAGGADAQTAHHLTLGGVRVGDQVRLTYPNGVQREYRVKGIFRAREMLRADHLAFVTQKEISSVFGRSAFSKRASQILVRVEPGKNENWFVEEFKYMGIKGEIRSSGEYGTALGSVSSSFGLIASLVSGIALVIAAIVIFIVIYISVLNKRRETGILRAIGIEEKTIIYSYLIQAVSYAVIGISLGWLMLNFLVQPYFLKYPLDIPLGLVSLSIEPATIRSSILSLLAAAIMAGFVPVLIITKQNIIKTIWGN